MAKPGGGKLRYDFMDTDVVGLRSKVRGAKLWDGEGCD